VFTDATLVAIAEARPRSIVDLIKVQGLGGPRPTNMANICWRSSPPRATTRDHQREISRLRTGRVQKSAMRAGVSKKMYLHRFAILP
jgi:hypothetical protein